LSFLLKINLKTQDFHIQIAVVLLTVKNPFISRDIFAHALLRLRLRIHEIKALKIYLFADEFSLHQITRKVANFKQQ